MRMLMMRDTISSSSIHMDRDMGKGRDRGMGSLERDRDMVVELDMAMGRRDRDILYEQIDDFNDFPIRDVMYDCCLASRFDSRVPLPQPRWSWDLEMQTDA